MKLRNVFTFVFLAIAAMFFMGSCSGCSSSEKQETFVPKANMQDTLRALDITHQFFETLKSGDIDAAVSMLHEIKKDTAHALSDSTARSMREYFTTFPVKEYEVRTSDFSDIKSQTVTYRYRFMDNPTDDPNYPVYMDFALDVVRIQSEWYLVLHNQKFVTKGDYKPLQNIREKEEQEDQEDQED